MLHVIHYRQNRVSTLSYAVLLYVIVNIYIYIYRERERERERERFLLYAGGGGSRELLPYAAIAAAAVSLVAVPLWLLPIQPLCSCCRFPVAVAVALGRIVVIT